MSILINWYDDDKRILWMVFPQEWNLTDYHQMIDRGAQMIEEQPHIVHVVYDFRDNVRVPSDLLSAGRYA